MREVTGVPSAFLIDRLSNIQAAYSKVEAYGEKQMDAAISGVGEPSHTARFERATEVLDILSDRQHTISAELDHRNNTPFVYSHDVYRYQGPTGARTDGYSARVLNFIKSDQIRGFVKLDTLTEAVFAENTPDNRKHTMSSVRRANELLAYEGKTLIPLNSRKGKKPIVGYFLTSLEQEKEVPATKSNEESSTELTLATKQDVIVEKQAGERAPQNLPDEILKLQRKITELQDFRAQLDAIASFLEFEPDGENTAELRSQQRALRKQLEEKGGIGRIKELEEMQRRAVNNAVVLRNQAAEAVAIASGDVPVLARRLVDEAQVPWTPRVTHQPKSPGHLHTDFGRLPIHRGKEAVSFQLQRKISTVCEQQGLDTDAQKVITAISMTLSDHLISDDKTSIPETLQDPQAHAEAVVNFAQQLLAFNRGEGYQYPDIIALGKSRETEVGPDSPAHNFVMATLLDFYTRELSMETPDEDRVRQLYREMGKQVLSAIRAMAPRGAKEGRFAYHKGHKVIRSVIEDLPDFEACLLNARMSESLLQELILPTLHVVSPQRMANLMYRAAWTPQQEPFNIRAVLAGSIIQTLYDRTDEAEGDLNPTRVFESLDTIKNQEDEHLGPHVLRRLFVACGWDEDLRWNLVHVLNRSGVYPEIAEEFREEILEGRGGGKVDYIWSKWKKPEKFNDEDSVF